MVSSFLSVRKETMNSIPLLFKLDPAWKNFNVAIAKLKLEDYKIYIDISEFQFSGYIIYFGISKSRFS